MGPGNVGDGLDFCHLQYPQIGLPLVELIKWIIVGAEVLRHPALASNGAVEHPTECEGFSQTTGLLHPRILRFGFLQDGVPDDGSAWRQEQRRTGQV